jgi:hypothetical protein
VDLGPEAGGDLRGWAGDAPQPAHVEALVAATKLELTKNQIERLDTASA